MNEIKMQTAPYDKVFSQFNIGQIPAKNNETPQVKPMEADRYIPSNAQTNEGEKKLNLKKILKMAIPVAAGAFAIGGAIYFIRRGKKPQVSNPIPADALPVKLSPEELLGAATKKVDKLFKAPKDLSPAKKEQWFCETIENVVKKYDKITADLSDEARADWGKHLEKLVEEQLSNVAKGKNYEETLKLVESVQKKLSKIPESKLGYSFESKYFTSTSFEDNPLLREAFSKSKTVPIVDTTRILPSDKPVQLSNVDEEFSNWVQKRAKVNQDIQAEYGTIVNPESFGFEIKPHTYLDDTIVESRVAGKYINKSSAVSDAEYFWRSFDLEGTKGYKETEYIDMMKCWMRHHFNNFDIGSDSRDAINKGFLQTAATSDGKKIVFFNTQFAPAGKFISGTDTRTWVNNSYALISRDGEFTQAQKDIIRIFADSKNKGKFMGEISPLQFSFTPTSDLEKVQHNKAAFFSALQSWAENSAAVDVDKMLKEAGGMLTINLN